jgi:hypothetical protein
MCMPVLATDTQQGMLHASLTWWWWCRRGMQLHCKGQLQHRYVAPSWCRMSKPVGKSRGRGIRLIRSLRELTTGPGGAGSLEEPIVLQRYVTNPLAVQVCAGPCPGPRYAPEPCPIVHSQVPCRQYVLLKGLQFIYTSNTQHCPFARAHA